jgi:hypothetical protein
MPFMAGPRQRGQSSPLKRGAASQRPVMRTSAKDTEAGRRWIERNFGRRL